MSDPTKTAFCPLYFQAHGGRFDKKMRPIIDGTPIPGLCGRAFDCGTCSLMTQWLVGMQDQQAGWECDACLKSTFITDKETRIERWIPGFFQSSQPDEGEPGFIAGCTRCGWQSSFLQLILRRQHG